MLEQLLSFERDLFLMLNNFQSAFLDNALWLYTGMVVWIPFVIFFLVALTYGKPRKEWGPILIALVTVVLIGHLFVAGIFKPYFARLRPVFHPDFINDVKTIGTYTGGGLYGFISGHSTFAFGFAMFTSLLFRYKPYSIVVFLWALIMVYSRIYFGVHFLSDVVAGTLMGLIIGTGVYYLYELYIEKVLYKDQEGITVAADLYSSYRKRLITYTFIGYIAFFTLFSKQIVHIMQ